MVAPARVAVLDDEFLCTAASFPDVLVALTVRGVERARRLGLQMAITELVPSRSASARSSSTSPTAGAR